MKNPVILCVCGVLFTHCASADPFAGMVAGASLGSVFGSSIGALVGGRTGYHLGTVVGGVTGGAVAVAVTSPRRQDGDARAGDTGGYEKGRGRKRRSDGNGTYSREDYEERERGTLTDGAPVGYAPVDLRNLRFIDETRNQTLNRRETCELVFELMNVTNRPLHNVVPYIAETNGNPHIYLSPSTRIERINPGEGIRYTAMIKTDNRLKAGTARFRIAVSCDGQDFVTLREFELTTAK